MQVCYDVEDFQVKLREIRALIKAGSELRCNSMKIITWDYEGTETVEKKKIEFIPLWSWLLESP
jgi:predicted AAA+ superfamily ATPase